MTTLLNSEFGQIITDKDREALKFLTNVTTTEKEDEETGLVSDDVYIFMISYEMSS